MLQPLLNLKNIILGYRKAVQRTPPSSDKKCDPDDEKCIKRDEFLKESYERYEYSDESPHNDNNEGRKIEGETEEDNEGEHSDEDPEQKGDPLTTAPTPAAPPLSPPEKSTTGNIIVLTTDAKICTIKAIPTK